MVFTVADIVILFLILFLALKGVVSGFIREFFSTLGMVGGIYLASHYSMSLAKILNHQLLYISVVTLKFVAFIIILALFWWSCSLIGKLLDRAQVSIASRVGGYIVAIFKYFIVISLIIFVLMQTASIRNRSFGKAIVSSKIYPVMKSSALWLLDGYKLTMHKSSKGGK